MNKISRRCMSKISKAHILKNSRIIIHEEKNENCRWAKIQELAMSFKLSTCKICTQWSWRRRLSIVITAKIKVEFSNLTSLVSREFDILCAKGIAFANKKGKRLKPMFLASSILLDIEGPWNTHGLLYWTLDHCKL